MAKRTFTSIQVIGTSLLALASDGTAWVCRGVDGALSDWRQIPNLPDSEDQQS